MENINNKTNQEIEDFIAELETKYQKLLKVANKLADEMDSLSTQYKEAKKELDNRRKK